MKIEEQRSGKRPKFARVVDGDVQNPLKEIRKDVGDNQREVRQWLEKMTAQIESLKKDGKRQETCSVLTGGKPVLMTLLQVQTVRTFCPRLCLT